MNNPLKDKVARMREKELVVVIESSTTAVTECLYRTIKYFKTIELFIILKYCKDLIQVDQDLLLLFR